MDAGIHPIIRHSREGGNPYYSSFPRRRESTPSSVIPAKAGIHPIIRHSREGGNPQFPRTREFNEKKHHPDQPDTSFPHRITFNVIPTHAGIHPIIRHPRGCGNPPHHPSFPRRRESTPSSVIPAKAGIHNSRARGNSTKRNTIQTNQTHHFHTELPSTSFPQRQESIPSSVIPAKAGIHNSRARGNSTKRNTIQTNQNHLLPLRTRESTPSPFPRRRESNDEKKPIQTNQTFFPTQNYGTSFPRTRESTPSSAIPAKVGMTDSIDSRLRGNDGVFFRALG